MFYLIVPTTVAQSIFYTWAQMRKPHLVEWQRVVEQQVSSNQRDTELKVTEHVVAESSGQDKQHKTFSIL